MESRRPGRNAEVFIITGLGEYYSSSSKKSSKGEKREGGEE